MFTGNIRVDFLFHLLRMKYSTFDSTRVFVYVFFVVFSFIVQNVTVNSNLDDNSLFFFVSHYFSSLFCDSKQIRQCTEKCKT